MVEKSSWGFLVTLGIADRGVLCYNIFLLRFVECTIYSERQGDWVHI
jgi:hypothetical protein